VIARKISFNHAPPSKLAHYAYLTTLYAFLFDLLIPSLGVHFNLFSYISYGIIIGGFSMKFILVGLRIRASSKKFVGQQTEKNVSAPEVSAIESNAIPNFRATHVEPQSYA